ncbi:MAG TPA: sigma-54 dependent transcriptional regulator, partial [Myxococcota bacterium]|nr:sigma-54 dependent transcriptional regulator [Myxococcota bacterium]
LQALNRVEGVFDADDESAIAQLASDTAAIIERTSLHGELLASDPKRLVDYHYNHIVGASPGMRQLYALVDTAASTMASVLLLGETGTGKSLVARAIHVNGKRADKPFVTLDCTTLPPSLIESELFGHERGAFTGAEKARRGKIEQAHGGTLFIDEIGDLPLTLQAKLLRVVQDHAFERVGGGETLTSDFRLISATHRDLETMVRTDQFRADLYYRVRVLPIVLPPLRERGDDDLTRLAHHFLRIFAKKHDRSVGNFSNAALQRLRQHDWPGNIRELENCIESAVVLAGSGRIEPKHLPLAELTAKKHPAGGLKRTLAEVERDHIAAVLADCDGNQSEAARRLGISRNTLTRKLV